MRRSAGSPMTGRLDDMMLMGAVVYYLEQTPDQLFA